MSPETRDSTIADIHRIRREIAARFDGDVFAINADAQARSEASGRQIIRRRRPSKKPPDGSGGLGTDQVGRCSPAAHEP